LEEEEDKIIRVFVFKPNSLGVFNLEFNRFILTPRNMTSWTSENEGADRISITLVLCSETKALLEEQDL